jgi:hypothetical protein
MQKPNKSGALSAGGTDGTTKLIEHVEGLMRKAIYKLRFHRFQRVTA